MCRVAIVAALEREVRPLTRRCSVREREYGGRPFRFFERGDVVAVCGGIGAEAARRAGEAIINLYAPKVIVSAGFAGALDPKLQVGDVVQPRRVVDAGDGSSVVFDQGDGVLVSFGSVAGAAQKAKLRDSFSAQAVDMEAAAVARAARAKSVEFRAIKAISDEAGFEFPAMDRFVDSQGNFLELRFAVFVAVRPWLWARVLRLMHNSNRAAAALCLHLERAASNPVGTNHCETVTGR